MVHAKSKTVNEAEDPNTNTYEPFLKAISIPSEFSGRRSIKAQQMQMKDSKVVIPGSLQKKPLRRASSTFDGIPPKRKPISRAKSFDENDFIGQLGRQRVPHKVKKDDDKSPTLRPPTPPKRVSPKATTSLADNDFKDKFGRQLPKAMKSLVENEVRGKCGRQLPKVTHYLEENVFMGHLGRGPPKATHSLAENEFKERIGRIPPEAAESLEESCFKGQLGRHSGHYDLEDELGRHSGHYKLKDDTLPEPPKEGVILSRLINRRYSGFAQVGPEPEPSANNTKGLPQSFMNKVANPPRGNEKCPANATSG